VGPITYRSLVMNPGTKRRKPQPPRLHRVAPASLAANPLPGRPWRTGTR
jgi:hypothetical protein